MCERFFFHFDENSTVLDVSIASFVGAGKRVKMFILDYRHFNFTCMIHTYAVFTAATAMLFFHHSYFLTL